MQTTAITYPLVTAPVGDWPMRCIYTFLPVLNGQLVALSPLGYISLVPMPNREEPQAHQAPGLTYIIAMLQAYEQRQGWLPQTEAALIPFAERLLSDLVKAIPPGQTRYLHQLVLATDLSPWLLALNELPAISD